MVLLSSLLIRLVMYYWGKKLYCSALDVITTIIFYIIVLVIIIKNIIVISSVFVFIVSYHHMKDDNYAFKVNYRIITLLSRALFFENSKLMCVFNLFFSAGDEQFINGTSNELSEAEKELLREELKKVYFLATLDPLNFGILSSNC